MEIFEHYFTESEEKRLFKTINRVDDLAAKRDLFWMKLMRQTGIRLSILAGPDPQKIKASRNQGIELEPVGLRVCDAEQSLVSGYLEYRSETNKRNKQHPIYLNKTARICLEGLLKIHRKQVGTHPLDLPYAETPLILSRQRRALSRRSFQQRMEHWCNEADVPVGSPHWLRHTWAQRYLERSKDPAALRHVQAVLGHSSINTTAIYTVPTKEKLADAMRLAQ